MGSLDSPLPSADSPDLALLIPTPAEKIECIRRHGVSWKGPLTEDQYQLRESHLLRQDLTKDGSLTAWVLVDRTLPPDSRPLLCGCETLAKRAFLAYDGKVEDIIAHGVGTVYCPPEHRGRGYAKRMMAELANVLETWQQEKTARKKAIFSVLYSDIGKSFYAQHGWKAFPSAHILLPAAPKSEPKKGNEGFDMSLLRDMTADDVKRYMISDAMIDKQREKLREASKVSATAKVAFAPDSAQMRWHWAREELYSELLCPEKGEVRVKGAAVPSRKVFTCWNRTFGASRKESTLYILWSLYDEPSSESEKHTLIEALAAVFRRAQEVAHEWEMNHVEFWNPSPMVQEALKLVEPNVELVHRDSKSVTSLKWDGKRFGCGETVDWVWNERYAWF